MNPPTLFTIGHSNHSLTQVIDRLKRYGITLVVDVRSSPWSRYNPRFNRMNLFKELESQGIAYLFSGKELGGRPEDPDCFDESGHIRYDRIAEKPWFRRGLARVLGQAKSFEIALMCAEKEPLHCHRTLLVSRALAKEGAKIAHILADGSAETHRETMERLIRGIQDTSSKGVSGRQRTLDLFHEGDSTTPSDPAAVVPGRVRYPFRSRMRSRCKAVDGVSNEIERKDEAPIRGHGTIQRYEKSASELES